jgi:peptidoglycan/xylan/chitin deacetylase (PgdA/CDA1 family)
MLDAIIFGIISVFLLIGKTIVFSAEKENSNPEILLPVIMYHSVRETTPSDYSVTPVQLENDLQYLSANGFNTVSAQQLVDYTNGTGVLPENPVLITLDDGFYNNLCYLLPLLEKYDMNAVISIVGSYTDNNAVADPHVPEYSYLTWDDINILLESGRIEIGNHTYNMHSNGERKGCSINLNEECYEYVETLESDISLLQSEMSTYTGTMPFVFAYPYGYISDESISVLHENGFLITLTCYEKINSISRNPVCLYGLGRFNRSGNYTTEEFMQKIICK